MLALITLTLLCGKIIPTSLIFKEILCMVVKSSRGVLELLKVGIFFLGVNYQVIVMLESFCCSTTPSCTI